METVSLHESDIVLISIVINKLFHFHCWQLENKLFFILKDIFFKSLLIESRGDGCFPSVFSIGAEAKLEAKRPGATRENQTFHQIHVCFLHPWFFLFYFFGQTDIFSELWMTAYGCHNFAHVEMQGYDIHMLLFRVKINGTIQCNSQIN